MRPLLFPDGGWEGLEMSKENFLEAVQDGVFRWISPTTPLPHKAYKGK